MIRKLEYEEDPEPTDGFPPGTPLIPSGLVRPQVGIVLGDLVERRISADTCWMGDLFDELLPGTPFPDDELADETMLRWCGYPEDF